MALIASYNESNYDGVIEHWASDTDGVGINFQSVGNNLASVKFYLAKYGSPAVNLYAKLYAHTGTYGTDGKPTGAALATSDAVASADLTTSMQLITFTFTGANQYAMSNGTYYVITLEGYGPDASNRVQQGIDTSSPSYDGNWSYLYVGGSWAANNTEDVIFYVYDDASTSSSSSSSSSSLSSSSSSSSSSSRSSSSSSSSSRSSSSSSSSSSSASSNVASQFEKTYLYKIYTSAGTFLTTWKDVVSDLNIKYEINAGLSVLKIRLARPETGYGENEDVKQGNRLKIYCYDKESGTSGVLVYSGILSSYLPTVEGSQEFVDITFFSQYWDLANKILESGSDTEVPYASVDPSAILTDLLDKYTALAGSVLDYATGTIDLTGTTVSYTYNTNNYQEAVKKVIELCPEGWYFRIGADDLVYLKAKEGTPTHKFTIGKDILSYSPEKRFSNIVNTVFFRGGDTGGGVYLYKKYTNSGSITAYGIRATTIVDQRVTVAGTAQIMANRVLDEKNNPEIRVVLKVLDSNNNSLGYDLESIKVGETCKILNATSKNYNLWDETLWDIDSWDYEITNLAGSQLQIMSIDYYPDYAILELSNKQPDISKRIEDIDRNFQANIAVDNPTAPS